MNWELLGHEWAVELLKRDIQTDGLRHAYLFTGARGIGRRTLALRFVQALNCPNPSAPGEPCLVCRTCQQIERQQYADLSLVQAEQEGKEIKIDQVRSLQHSLSLAPYESRYRIALLLNFQDANANAQNAMLKTLEEAPARVILLVTSDTLEGLLPTISSRCETIRLSPLPLERVASYLREKHGLEASRAQTYAHLSEGRVGFALRLLANPSELEKRQVFIDQVSGLLSANRRARFAYVETLTRDRDKARENMRQALMAWLSYWRDMLFCITGAETPLVNLEKQEELDRLAAKLSLPAVCRVLDGLETALERLDANVNPRLLGEALLLDWPRG